MSPRWGLFLENVPFLHRYRPAGALARYRSGLKGFSLTISENAPKNATNGASFISK